MNELYHHGVLGMHWGIRRYQPYSVVPRRSGKRGREIGDAKKNIRRATLATNGGRTDFAGAVANRIDPSHIEEPHRKLPREYYDALEDAKNKMESSSKSVKQITRQEAIQAYHNPEFKKKFIQRLESRLGDNCNDEILYRKVCREVFDDIFAENPEYLPESRKAFKEFQTINEAYHDYCKYLTNKLVDEMGDGYITTRSNLRYSDVVKEIIEMGGDKLVYDMQAKNADRMRRGDNADWPLAEQLYSMHDYNHRRR